MKITQQMAKHLREVFLGGNWTSSSLQQQLKDVTWQEATAKKDQFNTIATLVYHLSYYVTAMIEVLEGRPLTAKDEHSFSHPPVNSSEDWKKMVEKALADAVHAARLVEELPDEKLAEDFTDPKYGSYYRNIAGTIEHAHYHLGQIAFLKKMVTGS
jgi:hypothetical protein